ncbi:MAG: hypothetical protein ACREIS_14820 [Nitrospiraceae bacterium]
MAEENAVPLGIRNWLSPAETERLAILMEEMGEALQAVGKILRHGYESTNPLLPGSDTNRTDLAHELGDVSAAIQLLMMEDVEKLMVRAFKRAKIMKYKTGTAYLHHQSRSTLDRLDPWGAA